MKPLLCFLVILAFYEAAFGCPNGTIVGGSDGKSCFKISKTPRTWSDAEFDCQFNRGHLLSIHDAYTNVYLNGLADEQFSSSTNDYWLGATNQMQGGWQWIDDSSWNYANWASGKIWIIFTFSMAEGLLLSFSVERA